MSYLRMDPHHEKRTKHHQDVIGSSKHDRTGKGKGKALVGRYPPPRHHPSHSSSEEEEEHEMFERHSPIERSSHLALRYSKKMKQSTINDNHEAPVYEGSKQS
jgi:hypothetical protein